MFYMYDKLVLLISNGSFLVSHNTHRLITPTHTLINPLCYNEVAIRPATGPTWQGYSSGNLQLRMRVIFVPREKWLRERCDL